MKMWCTGLVLLVGTAAALHFGWHVAFLQALLVWVQTYSGSLLMLALAMLSLVPALLTMGSGPAETVSTLAFALFFWGRFQETHSLLPFSLALLGGALVAVELLLVPGVGKPFAIGAACLTGAIWDSYPDSQQGWQAAALGFATLGVSLFLCLRVLPRSRWTSRLIQLKPPFSVASRFDPAAELQALVGARGRATTALNPSGKARVGDRDLGVRSTEGFLASGTSLLVTGAESNQLLVRSLSE